MRMDLTAEQPSARPASSHMQINPRCPARPQGLSLVVGRPGPTAAPAAAAAKATLQSKDAGPSGLPATSVPVAISSTRGRRASLPGSGSRIGAGGPGARASEAPDGRGDNYGAAGVAAAALTPQAARALEEGDGLPDAQAAAIAAATLPPSPSFNTLVVVPDAGLGGGWWAASAPN